MVDGAFMAKTVWITGASGGLGEALAHAFHRAGARLILSARREAELVRVARNLRAGPDDVLVVPMDLADQGAIAAAVRTVEAACGSVNVLVNNAGLTQRALIRDAGLELYRRLFEVNVFGPLALTQAVLPMMTQAGGGQIVVISSIAALYSSPYRSGYNAAKSALHGLFDALRAEEHANKIAVSLIVLGSIRTQVSINALRANGTTYGRMDPAMASGMDPAEVARRIVEATERGREEITVAPLAQRWLVWRKKFFPALGSRAVRLIPKTHG